MHLSNYSYDELNAIRDAAFAVSDARYAFETIVESLPADHPGREAIESIMATMRQACDAGELHSALDQL